MVTRAQAARIGAGVQAESPESLRSLLSLLNWVVDASNDWIFAVDSDTHELVSFNRAFAEHYANRRGIVLEKGQRPDDLLPPDYAELWRGFYARATADGSFATDYDVYGGERRLRLNFQYFPDRRLIYMIGKDITEERRKDEELARRVDELIAATRTITALRAQVDERLRLAREVNDTVVQGLVAVDDLCQLGQYERAHDLLRLTLGQARDWIGELLENADLTANPARPAVRWRGDGQ